MSIKNPPHPGFHPHRNCRLLDCRDRSGDCASGFPASAVKPAERQGDLSGDMALRIEKAFGVRMDTLMRMQASYNIAQTAARKTNPCSAHSNIR